MSSRNHERYLVVFDVGHGTAAILRDEGGVVVFDTGGGSQVDHYCRTSNITKIEALFLSHADWDHIGGAVTLLLDKPIHVSSIFLNPDATKQDVDVFQQLRYAITEAEERGTVLYASLTVETKFPRKGASIEVLYPPAVVAMAGVGGKDLQGKRLSSNSLSAAIRIQGAANSAVLLAGDIEIGCLNFWKAKGIIPNARALVFPHHGGLAGKRATGAQTAKFAKELSLLVKPETVIFSIHRTQFTLPRSDVVDAIRQALAKVRFVCTQLPERLRTAVMTQPAWNLHLNRTNNGFLEGNIELKFLAGELEVRFLPD